MRKLGRWVGGLLFVLLIVWLAAGGLIWSRNSVPALNLPARPSLPAGNVYEDYLNLVRSVREAKTITALLEKPSSDPAERQRILQANGKVLERAHALAGKPSVVTELETKVGFVAALDFPNVTRLLALAAQDRLSRDPAGAMEAIHDGLAFSEGVLRGGAILHLTTGYMSHVPLLQVFPSVVSRLPADACRAGAERVRTLLQERSPVTDIMQNERRVVLRQFTSTFSPDATAIFSLRIPTDSYRWNFLLKPKAPAVLALNAYMERWVQEAAKPYGQITPPTPPTEMEGLMSTDTIAPGEMGKHILRYHYLTARLRLMYTALQLEHYRKTRGQYPPSLAALGNDPLFIDPFSGKPFIYHPEGAAYTLYSVGPNQKDEGGLSFPEGKMNPDRPGDLPLQPTFGMR